jgi:hypothetical protein
MEKIKYSKPAGFVGRGKGATNYKVYKWEIIYYDKENNEMKSGRYVSINDMNEKLGLNLTNDIVWRLTTLKKVDLKKRNKENSFLARYGHIKITKINIPVEDACRPVPTTVPAPPPVVFTFTKPVPWTLSLH